VVWANGVVGDAIAVAVNNLGQAPRRAAQGSLDVRACGEPRSARLSRFHTRGLAGGQKQPAGGFQPLDVKAREDKIDRVDRTSYISAEPSIAPSAIALVRKRPSFG